MYWRVRFGDLRFDLWSELDDFGMVRLIIEWVFRFYKFYRVPRYGLGVKLLG